MSFLNVYPISVYTKTSLKSYNFYIVQDKDTVFLIDAGIDSDESWSLFNHKLDELNLNINDIDFIILTHHHIDHIGLINRIYTKAKIPVYAHPKAFPHLRRDEEMLINRIKFFERLYEEMDCGENGVKRVEVMKDAIEKNKSQAINGSFIPLQDGDHIGRFEVIETPGHSIDHLSFYDRPSQYLFSGDVIFQHMNSNALIEFDNNGKIYPSLQKYEQTLKKLQSLPLTTIYSGHGQIIENPHELIDLRLKTIQTKSERILKCIEHQSMTASRIAKEIYGELYNKMFYFIMSEIIGHLNRLQSLRLIEYVTYQNVRYYYMK